MGKKTIIQNPVDWLAALSGFLIFLVENDIYGYEGHDPWGGYRLSQVDDSTIDVTIHVLQDFNILQENWDNQIETRKIPIDNYWTFIGDDFVFGITYAFDRQARAFFWSNAVVFPTGDLNELV